MRARCGASVCGVYHLNKCFGQLDHGGRQGEDKTMSLNTCQITAKRSEEN